MFKVNDVVVYAAHGVCEIVGTEDQRFGGKSESYFVLKPKIDKAATFYVPASNPKALAKMRKVMSRQEIDDLIDSMPNRQTTWIANENERREAYKKTIASGDQSAIISMIRTLYLHKKEREAEGKRPRVSDENLMKDAEQILYNEWQYVLNVDKDGLMAYIFERIETNK